MNRTSGQLDDKRWNSGVTTRAALEDFDNVEKIGF